MSGTLESIIQQDSQQYGLPAGLLNAQIAAESSFDPYAYNPTSGAAGIAQFIPSTAAAFGINPYDPSEAIGAAAELDSQDYANTGSWVSALQSYGTLPSSTSTLNAGQQNLFNIASAADQGSSSSGVDLARAINPSVTQNATQQGSGLGAYVTAILERGAVIMLGMVMLLGGFYLLGQRSGAIPNAVPVPV